MPHGPVHIFDIKKLTESQEGSSENARFSKPLLEPLIHLETFLPQPKQIDYLDSLVDNFILTRSESVNPASASEREELSCIFLELYDTMLACRILFLSIHMERKRILQLHFPLHFGETVVTEPPAVMNCTAAGYTSNGYADAISNIVHVPSVYIAEGAGNFTASFVAALAAYTGNAYGTDSTYIVPDGHVEAAYGTEAVVGTCSTINNATVAENASFVSPQVAGYDSAVDGNTNENGNAGEAVGGADAVQQFLDGSVPEMSVEEDRLWSIVKANSLDFDAWIALLHETEKVAGDKILKIQKVYDAFLVEFPLCYGYWNKYADHEAHLGFMDKVVEVYERAVLGVTFSVDIWLHYCIFAISMYEDPETIRRLFERGLVYVGTNYLSYPLWDKYIEYEELHAEWGSVAMIYARILEIPNRKLDDYFNRFKTFVASQPLSELKTGVEASAAAAGACTLLEDGGQAEKGEVHPDAAERPSKPVSSCLPNHLLSGKEACANYTEYWIRYVLCMEAYGNMDLANNALARATQVFVKRQPDIHLFAARFKEQNRDIPGARAAYRVVHAEIAPGLLEAITKHGNMERR
ncbi:hypothetical protein OIU84_016919 [Salix udensis]|uniref:Uncharacterized protein n=1 Tax=Salix udensis TaxID=889485 RepID=A0AAD6JBH5_9ROSI|nr:hypothetical protein OIU84_016919 [Salix udensis]